MKLKITYSILLGLFLSCVTTPQHHPTDKILLTEIVKSVADFHFQPKAIDDQLSEDFFTKYLAELDPQKVFFTQDDIHQLQPFQHQIDEELQQASFDFFDQSLKLLDQGITRAERFYKAGLTQAIDLNTNDTFETDPTKLAYAKNETALKDRWRLKIKRSLLSALIIEEKLNPTLSAETQKNNALQKVKQQYHNQFERQKTVKPSKRLQQFVNIYLRLNDFQSTFLSTAQKEEWDSNINRSFVGVGVQLKLIDHYPKIENVTIGGPVWKSKNIHAGDIILKIKSSKSSPIDLYGLTMKEIIQLLKGEKGTEVILTIQKTDDRIVDIPIIRDQITMDLATSVLLKSKQNNQKIGYIRLPRFYAGEDGAAAHILAELRQLKNNKVDGIIFDVRNNHGGRSNEAREILGFFLEQGVVMQTKRRDSEPNVYEDEDGRAFYDGELIVLVNSHSSSASELLSGTLQDYDRAVIVGGNATYGKGTMQNFFNLDTAIDSIKYKFGDIKLSVGKFYTASGRSPQHEGIIPDIKLPDDDTFVTSGQRIHPNSFPTKEIPIKVCQQKVNNNPNLDQVIVKSKKRVEKNKRFILAAQKAKQIKEQQENSTVSLNYQQYKKASTDQQLKEKAYSEIFSTIDDFQVSMLPEDFNSTDSAFLQKQERLIQKLSSDPYLYECFWIMKDLCG